MVELPSERFVAGRLVHEPELLARLVARGVTTEHFEDADYRTIFSTAKEVVESGDVSQSVMLHKLDMDPEELRKITIDSFDDDPKLMSFHITTLCEAHAARRSYLVLERAVQQMPEVPLKERKGVLEEAMKELLSVSDMGSVYVKKTTDLKEDFLADLRDRKKVSRIMTGMLAVDAIVIGLMNSRVTVVAGGTNHGKSLFADEIIINVASRWKQQGVNKQVVKFSCEDDHDANALRLSVMCANQADPENGVDIRRVVEHMEGLVDLTPAELEKIKRGAEYMGNLNVTIDGNSSPDRAYVMSRLMAAAAEAPIGLIVFDYLEFTGEQAQTKTQAIDQTMVLLHEAAKRFGCPVIAVSQLKESASDNPGGHPKLSDLSWSGFIKKIAAQVIMVHSAWEHWIQAGQAGEKPDPLEYFVHIRKNKGDVGTAKMQHHKQKLRIVSPTNMQVVF